MLKINDKNIWDKNIWEIEVCSNILKYDINTTGIGRRLLDLKYYFK